MKKDNIFPNNGDLDGQLILAAMHGNLVVVEQALKSGADIHATHECALRWSANNGHFEIVKYLVENGANVYVFNSEALYWSVRNNHLKIVKYLLAHHNNNQKPVLIQLLEWATKDRNFPLQLAILDRLMELKSEKR